MALPLIASLILTAAPSAPIEEQLISPWLTQASNLGTSMSVWGTTAAVGAPGTIVATVESGAVVVFVQDGAAWVEQAVVTTDNLTGSGPRFGASVAVWGDTLVVGASHDSPGGIYLAGSAFVFTRSGTSWTEVAQLQAPPPFQVAFGAFGSSVAIEDGTIVVGARRENGPGPDEGAAYVYIRSGSSWQLGARLTGPNPLPSQYFGDSTAISGDTVLIGAPGSYQEGGRAYVFTGAGTTWSSEAVLFAASGHVQDMFGDAVAIDGDQLVVGSPQHTHGSTVYAGAAFVFSRSGATWTEDQKLQAPVPKANGDFGTAVAMNAGLLMCGAQRLPAPFGGSEGGAYVFRITPEGWSFTRELTAAQPSELFGASVAVAGATALVGAPGFDFGVWKLEGARCLAFDPGANTLLVADDSDRLVDIEPFPSEGVELGTLSYQVDGMTFDPGAGVLYGTDAPAQELMSIDPSTGDITLLGQMGFSGVRGLAFHSRIGTLFGVDNGSDQLIALDPATGAGTAVGPLGFNGAHGLACDPRSGVLYATDGQLLYTVDPTTGAGTPVGEIAIQGKVKGLAFDGGTGRLHGIVELPVSLLVNFVSVVEIDTATAQVGNPNPLWLQDGGTVYASEVDLTETYCTAGTSASGCQAAIAASGAPSVTAASGFHLGASSAEGAKSGIFFFGTAGRQASAWGNGTSFQCVVPPVARAGLINGTGTAGSCDGAFSQDLNALWCPSCPSPQKNPGAGVLVQAQLWYRDPQNTSNQSTSLSNAVEFLVGL